MVLLNHGIFSFGNTAKKSYDRMIDLVSAAEEYLVSQNAWDLEKPSVSVASKKMRNDVSQFRWKISSVVGSPVLLNLTNSIICIIIPDSTIITKFFFIRASIR